MGRHEQREQIFKLLYSVEYHSEEEMMKQVKLYFEDDEIMISDEDSRYITEKLDKIREKLKEIDHMINDKAQGWDTDRMGKVELAILRLAAFEILYDDQVPTGVAINEAVEIAKKYGQENAGGFVNAILAKFV